MATPPPDPDALKELFSRVLGSIKDVSTQPDPETLREEEDLEKQHTKALLQGLLQDINERKKYAKCFFILACCWLGAITGLLLLHGFGSFWFGRMPFKLPDSVLLAVIGSTTVNVLGILYVVANYLFPKR
jgi:hypothetical protein